MKRLPAAALLLAALFACGPKTRIYHASGVVVGVDVQDRQLKVAHGNIPGFMPAMTMSFDVAPGVALERLKRGERVRFVLERGSTYLRITRVEKTGEGSKEVPEAGEGAIAPLRRERAPDFRLIDQNAHRFVLSDLRGRAVLLDFIFTQCTGPCPILTDIHVRLQRRVPPALRDHVRFVSVSIDPVNDTPERLRVYAHARGADLANWSFLTGKPAEVAAVLSAYHVGAVRLPDKTLNHTIVTYLIDREGFIRNTYVGLEANPDRLLADLEEAAS
jgi:protein SCO1/2